MREFFDLKLADECASHLTFFEVRLATKRPSIWSMCHPPLAQPCMTSLFTCPFAILATYWFQIFTLPHLSSANSLEITFITGNQGTDFASTPRVLSATIVVGPETSASVRVKHTSPVLPTIVSRHARDCCHGYQHHRSHTLYPAEEVTQHKEDGLSVEEWQCRLRHAFVHFAGPTCLEWVQLRRLTRSTGSPWLHVHRGQ
jgi:hypothetical protein